MHLVQRSFAHTGKVLNIRAAVLEAKITWLGSPTDAVATRTKHDLVVMTVLFSIVMHVT